tara:strand:- start:405 stop:2447 length:2043 start_codon:yes stop_codon:yes gene_type:complete
MAVDFNLPTVATSYTAFPTQIIENIDAALQQLAEGSPSNVPTNAIKWDKTANRWKKYDGSAYVDLTGTYNLNANVLANNFDLPSDGKLKLGNSDEFTIFHQASNGNAIIKETGGGVLSIQTNGANITLRDNSNAVNMAQFISGGSCTFRHGANERLRTLSTGVEVLGTSLDLGDNVSLHLGTNDDFKLVHNDTDGTIENTKGILNIKKSDGSGSSQAGIKMEANSAISLFHSTGTGASNPQFATTANGIYLRGSALGSSLNDEVIFFDSHVDISNDGHVQIKHVRDATTSTSWETSATRIQMRVDSTDQGYIQFNGSDNNSGMELGTYQGTTLEKFAFFVRGGKSELYFDNVAKLATKSNGVDITGGLKTTDSISIENTTPEFYFIDTTATPDYKIRKQSGHFMIMETGQTNDSQWRFSIRNGGTVNIPGNLDVGAGIDCTGALNTTGELNFTGSAAKFIDFETLANSHRFELRHHNPTGNLFETAIKATANGSVEMFYDAGTTSAARLSTTANGISLPSANTANSPALSFGTDTNSGIFHRQQDSIGFSAGGQIFYIDTNGLFTNTAKGIHLKAQNNTQFLTLKPSATMANNFSLTFPNADTTVAGYALISNGSGQLSWGVAGAGAQGGGSDEIFWENGQTVTTNYTITNGKNAGSFGPITINSGVTVTIGSGETWTIV